MTSLRLAIYTCYYKSLASTLHKHCLNKCNFIIYIPQKSPTMNVIAGLLIIGSLVSPGGTRVAERLVKILLS